VDKTIEHHPFHAIHPNMDTCILFDLIGLYIYCSTQQRLAFLVAYQALLRENSN
jgi:hypothetical protein